MESKILKFESYKPPEKNRYLLGDCKRDPIFKPIRRSLMECSSVEAGDAIASIVAKVRFWQRFLNVAEASFKASISQEDEAARASWEEADSVADTQNKQILNLTGDEHYNNATILETEIASNLRSSILISLWGTFEASMLGICIELDKADAVNTEKAPWSEKVSGKKGTQRLPAFLAENFNLTWAISNETYSYYQVRNCLVHKAGNVESSKEPNPEKLKRYIRRLPGIKVSQAGFVEISEGGIDSAIQHLITESESIQHALVQHKHVGLKLFKI